MSRSFATAARRGLFGLVVLGVLASVGVGSAQPSRRKPATTPAPSSTGPTNLRAHVGTDHASRLLRSLDPDERLRGIERAARIGTPEAVALLVETLERSQPLRADSRALLAMARGLARFADQERARKALLDIVGTSGGAGARVTGGRTTAAEDEGDPVARTELARQVAAIALARAGGDRALEALFVAGRNGGPGQSAALLALGMHPPRDPGFFGTTGSMPAPVVRLLGQLGDLRALDVLHSAAKSSDVGVRCAALVALAELGDERAGPLARAAIAESDVRLRAASGEVFILLSAPERFKATTAILSDEATVAIGIKMAERVHNPEITRLVAARALEHPDRELRQNAIRALGRSPDPGAAKALATPALLGDRELAYHALSALARSPAPNAGSLIGGLLATRWSTLAVRAYVVRALVRGERSSAGDETIVRLAASQRSAERALGAFARVALGDSDAESLLGDRDPKVRRAAVIGSMARRPSPALERSLLRALSREDDPVTRQVLGIGLAGGDPDGLVKTSTLIDRAESGGGDAPLAAFALARRADESTLTRGGAKIGPLLAGKDAVLRAHVARGLGASSLPDASGRLASAYTNEPDGEVRRALIGALAAREVDGSSPSRKEALALAADLDPDGPTRQAARRALAGATVPFGEAAIRDVAWLRIALDSGEAPKDAYAGYVLRSDGLAVPVAFDDEGFLLVPGLSPGEGRLVLAPKLPSDKTPPRTGP